MSSGVFCSIKVETKSFVIWHKVSGSMEEVTGGGGGGGGSVKFMVESGLEKSSIGGNP